MTAALVCRACGATSRDQAHCALSHHDIKSGARQRESEPAAIRQAAPARRAGTARCVGGVRGIVLSVHRQRHRVAGVRRAPRLRPRGNRRGIRQVHPLLSRGAGRRQRHRRRHRTGDAGVSHRLHFDICHDHEGTFQVAWREDRRVDCDCGECVVCAVGARAVLTFTKVLLRLRFCRRISKLRAQTHIFGNRPHLRLICLPVHFFV